MDCKKTGAFICSLRKEKGLTQAAMAEKLGISNRTISKWENGDGMPDISILSDVASILGITVDELLKGEKNPETPPEITVTEVSNKDNINNIFKMLYITSMFFAVFGSILGTVTEIYSIWAFDILFYTHWEIIFSAISFVAIMASALVFSLAVTRLQVSYSKDEIISKVSRKALVLGTIISVFPITFILRIIDVSRFGLFLPLFALVIITIMSLIIYKLYNIVKNT